MGSSAPSSGLGFLLEIPVMGIAGSDCRICIAREIAHDYSAGCMIEKEKGMTDE